MSDTIIILLSYSTTSVIYIKLTSEEEDRLDAMLDADKDVEDFMRTIEDKYDFKVDDCNYMICSEGYTEVKHF